jgi:hypothetical protein
MTDIPTMKRRLYEALFQPDGLTLRDADELHLDVIEMLAELERLRRERLPTIDDIIRREGGR